MSINSSLSVDMHTHILPKNYPNLKEKYGYGGFIRLEHHKPLGARMMMDNIFFREIKDNIWNSTARIQDCNSSQVSVQVLSTVPVMFNYWAKPKHTLNLSMLLNDHMSSVVKADPKRFIGLGTLPMQSPKLAINELERCITTLGLSGVQIGTHINNWNLDSPEVFAVMEAMQDLGAALFIHPWDMMGKENMPKYWLPWLIGMPAETSLAISSMIFGGIFERLPNLRVAFAHGGGSFPFTIGRIEQGFNVRPDLCAVDNNINPREYFNKFYIDSLVHDKKLLSYLVEVMGEDKIMLGSDYPFSLGEATPGKLISSLNVEDEIEKKMLGLNALKWLNLDKKNYL